MPTALKRRSASVLKRNAVADDTLFAFQCAADAFRRAEYEQCKSFLRICEAAPRGLSGRVQLLRAKLARIEGDLETWYAASGAVEGFGASIADRMTAMALRAIAAKRLGKVVEMRHRFTEIQAVIETAGSADAAYAVYLLATDAWEDRDLVRAERLISDNVRSVGDPESLALLGWIEVRRERYRHAGIHFLTALTRLVASGEIDVRLQGRLVHAAAVVASETIDLRLGRRIRREYENMVWPESLRVEQFNAITCLRFLALLEGDVERAWMLSRAAVAIAPRPSYVAIGETNAAVASGLLGDSNAHRLQLGLAWGVLRTRKWSGIRAEERVALTNFMIEARCAFPSEARKALMMYRSFRAKADRSNALEDDRRITAFEAFAAAKVCEAFGQRSNAIQEYRRSLKIWNELAFGMRAALVALDLRRLTGDEGCQAILDAALERAPNAWFAQDAKRLSVPVYVWPAQREVLSRLLEGKSAKAIAVELERSSFTVTNHTRKLFASFGVHSRDELRARCAALGVTIETLRRAL